MSTPAPIPWVKELTDDIVAQVAGALLCSRSVLVGATAGAGKTTLLTTCLASCLKDIGQDRVQVVAFNVAACEEIRGRCALVARTENYAVDTIQAVLETAFRDRHLFLRRVSYPQREDILAKCLSPFGPEVASNPRIARRLRLRLEGTIRTPADPGSLDAQVLEKMAIERHRRRLYDALDVEAWARRSPSSVAEYLIERRSVKYLLVDEAQDLSRVEWSVVAACIAAGITVLAVGDTDQTINVFRGADASGMASLIQHRTVDAIDLPVTWRAKQALVAYQSPLRQALFPGSSDLVAAIPGGIGARATVHLGDRTRASRTIANAVLAEVMAALGRKVPASVIGGLPKRYDVDFLKLLPSLGLRDLALLVATNKEASQMVDLLRAHGVEAVLLSKRPPDPLAGSGARIVLSALDPWGETSDYPGSHRSLWLRCLLFELGEREGSRIEERSPAGRSLRELLTKLVETEGQGREALVSLIHEWLDALEKARLGEEAGLFVGHARRMMRLVLEGADDPASTRRLIGEIAALYDLYYPGDTEPYAVVRYGLALDQDRLGTARGIRRWPSHSKANTVPPLKDGEGRVVVAVINQAKGLTFEATWVCALHARTFPFRGRDCHEERCRYWVACTRATDLLVVHVPASDRGYPEMAGPVIEVGEPKAPRGSWSGPTTRW